MWADTMNESSFPSRGSLCRDRRPPLRAASPLATGPSGRPLPAYVPAPLPRTSSPSSLDARLVLSSSTPPPSATSSSETDGRGGEQRHAAAVESPAARPTRPLHCRDSLGRCRRRAPKLSARQAHKDGTLHKKAEVSCSAAPPPPAETSPSTALGPPRCRRARASRVTHPQRPLSPLPHRTGCGVVLCVHSCRLPPTLKPPCQSRFLGGKSNGARGRVVFSTFVALDIHCRARGRRRRRARRGSAHYPLGTHPRHGHRGERGGVVRASACAGRPWSRPPLPMALLGGRARGLMAQIFFCCCWG